MSGEEANTETKMAEMQTYGDQTTSNDNDIPPAYETANNDANNEANNEPKSGAKIDDEKKNDLDKQKSVLNEDIDLSGDTLQIRLKDLKKNFKYTKREVYCIVEAILLDVDIGRQTFDTEMKFEFYWQQPDKQLWDLLDKPENRNRSFEIFDDQESIPIDLDDPFAGDLALDVIEKEYTFDREHKVVSLLYRITNTFTERMELQRFPCDRQFLNVLLKGRIDKWIWLGQKHKPKWLDHIDNKLQIKTTKGPSVGEYHMEKPWGDFRIIDTLNEHQPPFKIRFRIQRLPNYYIGNVIIPLILITACCFSSLTIDLGETADRLSVSITLMLAAVAFRFVLAEMLPNLPYLTWMDNYTTFSFGIVALFILQNSVSAYLTEYPNVDLIYGIVVAGLLLAVNVWFILALVTDWFRKSWDDMDIEDRQSDDAEFTFGSVNHRMLGDRQKSQRL